MIVLSIGQSVGLLVDRPVIQYRSVDRSDSWIVGSVGRSVSGLAFLSVYWTFVLPICQSVGQPTDRPVGRLIRSSVRQSDDRFVRGPTG